MAGPGAKLELTFGDLLALPDPRPVRPFNDPWSATTSQLPVTIAAAAASDWTAVELTLPPSVKSSAQRRPPWPAPHEAGYPCD
jgi:hypothetical protein